jgi:hypothetical protein
MFARHVGKGVCDKVRLHPRNEFELLGIPAASGMNIVFRHIFPSTMHFDA